MEATPSWGCLGRVLRVNQGSLYPALQRLETAQWERMTGAVAKILASEA